jgi:hypothetical protein
MGSDRARISYNDKQQYRAVVEQQGRVTLEADGNEAQQIFSEEIRREALDVVGPAGTPDNGYEIILPVSNLGNFDFEIRPGTMYVGGLRVHLTVPTAEAGPIRYRHQPDWIDPSDPAPKPPVHEFVYLHLQEQEISALEDADLKDVALGGPDTTARLRLIQRIVRRPTQAHDCAGALAEAVVQWQAAGLDFNTQTLRLLPRAQLQVSFQNLVGPPDPCEPIAQGGYLGAENQLIRIQVTAPNRFVWGYDNASFLYRVEQIEPDHRTLTLRPRPVDAPHQPRQNQAVEVLRSVARLSNGEYVAYATDRVQTLSTAYDPDMRQVLLAAVLPTNYLMPGGTPRLFLRVWEEELDFAPGVKVALGATGLQVTLRTTGGSQFHVGDTWTFAVRPSTPTEVYPQRYHTAFQPVEGPRQWICPLAVIAWNNGQGSILGDCREHFDNLVELTKRTASGCCTVVVRPEDLQGNVTLQAVIDRFVVRAKATVCLMPGDYLLQEPLRLGPQHAHLTLEGCHDGAVLQAAPGREDRFRDGLIVLTYANNVTLQRLRFRLPLVPYAVPGGREAISDFRLIGGATGPQLEGLHVSIGIRPMHCANLTIRDCLFRFRVVPHAPVFGVGIFASSECWGLVVQGNRFLHDEEYLGHAPFRMLAGFLLVPSTTVVANRPRNALVLLPWLHQAEFRGNEFAGLTIPILVYSDAGLVRLEENTVIDCYAGFWLLSLRSLLFARLFSGLAVNQELSSTAAGVSRAVYAMTYDPVTQLLSALARSYPLPDHFDTRDAVVVEGVPSVIREEPLVDARRRPVYERLLDLALGIWGRLTGTEPVELDTGAAAAPAAGDMAGIAERLGVRASALHLRLMALERAAARQALDRRGLSLALHIANNHIDALVAAGPSSIGLIVFDSEQDTQSTLDMTANRIRTRSAFAPAAIVAWVERCTITGNLILNEQPRARIDIIGSIVGIGGPMSLSLFPGTGSPVARALPFAAVAVTGNLFQGRPVLPQRQPFQPQVPPPMNTWEFLNTVI